MNSLNYTILYVRDIQLSTKFYTDLLGNEPAESSPHFSMFALPSGFVLGLWSENSVVPKITGTSGFCEIGMRLQSQDEVKNLCEVWSKKGITILQTPTEMDFGYTFTATDPDGHRIRVAYITS